MSDSTDPLDACQQRINYRFKNPDLLRAAMTHASSADMRRNSNERLEFLGDAVLGLVVCHTLYERLPNAMEGDLTKIKSAVVSRRVCALVADQMRLPEALKCGQGMEQGEGMPRSLAAAALEALIAAIYLDGGFEAAQDFIRIHMSDELERAIKSDHQFNFKSQLQQYAQRELAVTPTYQLLDEKGPDHSKCFEVAVSVGNQHFPSAWGPSKKEAEQKAAWMALNNLGVMEDETPAED
ncbi:MAG: ribonuclease III [Planctomycetota bacterium]